MKNTAVVSLLTGLVMTSMGVHAVDVASLPEAKRTQLGLYLTAAEAYALASREKVLFIDVRSRAEVNFLGMPTIADANIPYMEMDNMYSWDEKKGVFRLEPNSGFTVEVADRLKQKGMSENDKIIVMCRSGDRSSRAVDLLAKTGFKNVYSVVDGYEGDMAKDGDNKGKRVVNGWKNSNLPWTYSLNKQKMYFQ